MIIFDYLITTCQQRNWITDVINEDMNIYELFFFGNLTINNIHIYILKENSKHF